VVLVLGVGCFPFSRLWGRDAAQPCLSQEARTPRRGVRSAYLLTGPTGGLFGPLARRSFLRRVWETVLFGICDVSHVVAVGESPTVTGGSPVLPGRCGFPVRKRFREAISPALAPRAGGERGG
jgi:hypothetical protein